MNGINWIVIAQIVKWLIAIYLLLIFIRVILVWLRPNMFNPIVQFVYNTTDPYLKLFAGIKFLRIGNIDFTPILALFLLYLLMILLGDVIKWGYISAEHIVILTIELLFKFVYFIIFIFIIAVGLRFIFEVIGMRVNNVVVSIVYSISEPAVKPLRNILKVGRIGGFDIHVLISLVLLILLRYLILPKILNLITLLISW